MSRKIIGVTVGTQLPKPNFKQNDPTKGDYIKNKPDFEGLESRVDTMSNLVGDTKVSDQIANAIVNKVDKVDGQRLITTDEADKLKALVIGENGQVGISGTVNADNVQGLAEKLALKVDKVDGKGLSTNDYTTAEKNKLAAIETGANKTVVDSALNETSTNPVQNKVVNAAISDLNTLVGNTKVSDQISDAINTHRADMNASMDEPGHIVHRTHYSKYIATLIDNAVINNDILSANRGEFCYNDIKDYDELTVIFDGVVYECPITVKHGEESYFYAGNFQDSAPEYPFYILGYLANESVMISVGEGDHIVSVKLSEVAKKLDAKYLPDDVVAASDWSAKEGEAGHILNRTHYKETNIVDIVPSGSFTLDEWAYCMAEANGRLVAGKTYVATIDGVKYERVATYDEEFEAAYIGNLEVFWGNESENADDDAFCFMVAEDGMADISLVSSDYANKTITFSVQEFTEVIHKLPLEYLDAPDWSAAEGKPGHILNRTHYSEPEVIFADNIEITISGMYPWISYNAIKDYEEITVIYDGVTYVCPITFGVDTSDNNNKYFYFGNWNNNAPEYPFIFFGYETLAYAAVTVPDGSHTLSVMAGEYVKKLDKKYLPDDIGGGVSSWNDLTDKPFDSVVVDPVFDGDMTGLETVLADVNTGAHAVKITHQVVSVDELVGSTLTLDMGGTEQSIVLTKEMVMDASLVLGVSGAVVLQGTDPIILSLPNDSAIQGAFFAAGTWFMCIPDTFHVKSVSCLYPSEYVTKKLDAEIIDAEWMAAPSKTIVANGYTTFNYNGGTWNDVNSKEKVMTSTSAVSFGSYYDFYVGEKKYSAKCLDPSKLDPEIVELGFVASFADEAAMSNQAGFYAHLTEAGNLWIYCPTETIGRLPVRVVGKGNIVPLPEEYLPESVATKEYVDNAISSGATGGAQIQIITWEADD